MPLGSKVIENMCDYLLWYAKDKNLLKYRQLFVGTKPELDGMWRFVELPDGNRRKITRDERECLATLPKGSKIYTTVSQLAPSYSQTSVYGYEFLGKTYRPPSGQCWVTTKEKMDFLAKNNRLQVDGNLPRYILYHGDFPYSKLTNPWLDTAAGRKSFQF